MHKYFPLKVLIPLAGISRRTYYYQINAQSLDKDLKIKQQIRQLFKRHQGCYGYPRITASLQKMGLKINHKKVYRLMQELKLKAVVRPKKRRYFIGHQAPTAPNLLKRNFTANHPRERLVTDITEFNLAGKKLYLSPIMDLFNREIVAFTLSESPTVKMVTTMLDKAIKTIGKGKKRVLHSDQGWHYRHFEVKKRLKTAQITQSMSRKGTCLDNAAMESFFAVLKSECFHGRKIDSIADLKKITTQYIHYYNHHRIKAGLNFMTPVEFRLKFERENLC